MMGDADRRRMPAGVAGRHRRRRVSARRVARHVAPLTPRSFCLPTVVASRQDTLNMNTLHNEEAFHDF